MFVWAIRMLSNKSGQLHYNDCMYGDENEVDYKMGWIVFVKFLQYF